MVASISSTPNPRSFTSQPPKRPPILPSDSTVEPDAAGRRPKFREVTSRYLASTPVASRTAPNTPVGTGSVGTKRSQSVDRRRPGTPDLTAAAKLLVGNGSKRSLSASLQGEGFSKPASTPSGAERRRNVVDENSRPSDQWRGNVTRSLDSSTLEKKKVGGHVARALQLQQSVDDSSLSSVSGSTTTASDMATSDAESVSSRRGRVVAVPARFLQETSNRRRLADQNSLKRSFSDSIPVPSTPGMPGGSASSFNDYVRNTPSVLSFASDARRGKVVDNKGHDLHELRMLQNRQLQWQFANARAAAAMQTQKDTAEKTLHHAWESTSKLRNSVISKRTELQQLKQQLKLYSVLKGKMLYLDEWEILEGDFSSSLAKAVESLLACTSRLPLVRGAKANAQEVEDAISSANIAMHGIGSSLFSLLEKVVETNSLASELASISSNEQASLDQCRDLLSTLTAMQVEDSCLRTQILQLNAHKSTE